MAFDREIAIPGYHSQNGTKRHVRRIAQEEWETHKDYIYQKYILEDRPLVWVLEQLRETFNFSASLKQFKTQLKTWNFKKRRRGNIARVLLSSKSKIQLPSSATDHTRINTSIAQHQFHAGGEQLQSSTTVSGDVGMTDTEPGDYVSEYEGLKEMGEKDIVEVVEEEPVTEPKQRSWKTSSLGHRFTEFEDEDSDEDAKYGICQLPAEASVNTLGQLKFSPWTDEHVLAREGTPKKEMLCNIAEEFIKQKWSYGNWITYLTAPQFAAEVLTHTRRLYLYLKTRIATLSTSTGFRTTPTPQENNLNLEDLKFLFEQAIKPRTEHVRKDLFQCPFCPRTGMTKHFAFESFIQHYSFKHAIFSSQDAQKAFWKADWPDGLWNEDVSKNEGASEDEDVSEDKDEQQLRILGKRKPLDVPIEVPLQIRHTVSVAADPTNTDSGYASRNLNSIDSLNSITSAQHESHTVGSIDDDDDARSIYSDDSIATTLQDDLVYDFSEQFAKDLGIHDFDATFSNELLHDFQSSLLDFSLRLWHESATAEGRAAMKFVHKHRRHLAQSFFKSQVFDGAGHQCDSTYSESGDDNLNRFPGQNLSMQEKMELWDRKTAENLAVSARPPDETLVKTEAFEKYYNTISRTSSYRWLQSTILNQLHLLGHDAIQMQFVKKSILDVFPRPKRIGRRSVPTITRAIFKVHWPLRQLIRKSTSSQARSDQLGLILTLTGDLNAAQALTCSDYLEQTWPTTGAPLLDLILKMIQTNKEQVLARDDGTQLTIYENGENLLVAIEGSRGAAAELGQQLCWLSAALQTSSSEQKDFRAIPRIRHLDSSEKLALELESRNSHVGRIWKGTHDLSSSEPAFFAITVDLEPLISVSRQEVASTNGGCWIPMFDNVTIVNGYPIRRRKQSQNGLEAPLNLIAALAGTKFADQFDGKLFIKGHSSMLISSDTTDDLLLWHYCHGTSLDYISYFDHAVSNSIDLELERLPHLRHIVGWCEEADFGIGSSKLCHSVEWSRLKPLSDMDHRNAHKGHLSAPVRVTDGKLFVLLAQNQAANSVPEDYETIFRRLSGKFALLWDVDGQRGWLINMLATLLQLIRDSLQIDQKLLDNLFILKPEDLVEPGPGPLAARKFLSNTRNLRAKVSVSKVTDTFPDEHEILESRMVRFYHVLNEALDHQRNQHRDNAATSKYLTGWDFRSIASQKGSSMRSICIPAEGRGWAELVKASGAVTLFGNGFGELISASSNCTSLCKYWRTLPTNKHYVAISAYDLYEMAEAYECNVANDPNEFIPNMLWHSPRGQNNTCGCDNRGCKSSCLVQVLLPKDKRSATLPASEQVNFGKFMKGAFCFGHNESVAWQWQDENNAQELSEMALSKAASSNRSGELSRDSGYETMDISSSVDALSRMPSYATSESQNLSLTRSNDISGIRPSQKVYSSASFNGGKSHLGDNLGDRYENCQFNFGSSQPGLYQPQSFSTPVPPDLPQTSWRGASVSRAPATQPHSTLLDAYAPVASSSQHSAGQSSGPVDADEDESMDELHADEQNRTRQAGLQQKHEHRQHPIKKRKRK